MPETKTQFTSWMQYMINPPCHEIVMPNVIINRENAIISEIYDHYLSHLGKWAIFILKSNDGKLNAPYMSMICPHMDYIVGVIAEFVLEQ